MQSRLARSTVAVVALSGLFFLMGTRPSRPEARHAGSPEPPTAVSLARATTNEAPGGLARLGKQIEAFTRTVPGSVGVAVKHLESSQEVYVLPNEPFPMASTFKVPILVEVLAQVRQGKLSLDDEVELLPEHQHLGSGLLAHLVAPGAKLTVRNLMQLMMIISDNSATDLLLEMVGAENVNARLADANIDGVHVDRSCQRLILDYVGLDRGYYERRGRDEIAPAMDALPWNDPQTVDAHMRYYYDRRDSATPAGMNRLLEQIVRAEILPREDCDLILEIMKRCQTGEDRLAGLLPPGTVLAHKTGTVGTTVNDVGLIYLPDGLGHVAITVFTKDPQNDNPMFDRSRAERVIAQIARAAYDYFYFTGPADEAVQVDLQEPPEPAGRVETSRPRRERDERQSGRSDGARRPIAGDRGAAARRLPADENSADAVYTNATVYAVDAGFSVAEALAVKGDRILAVGDADALLRKHRGDDTQVVDLDGRTVVPGLIDAHGHFKSLGEVKLELDLVQTTSYDEAIEMVRRRAKELEPGTWIVGRRWDQANWGLKDFPTHRKLSEVVPNHPVYLTRVDGHAVLVNAKALELAGITDGTPDPDGGDILRDADGHATGVLVDNAGDVVAGVIERQRLPLADLARAAQEACFQVGLTSVHDAGTAAGEIPRWKQLYDSGLLKIRLYVMLSGSRGITDYFAENRPLIGYGDNRLTVRACKLFVDGAMGSRGAWMLEPYADKPVNDEGDPYTGLVLTRPEEIRRIAVAGLENRYQICTHAIGDRGNREVLNAYASAFKEVPADDPRFRIEHAQCVALEDIPRFAELGVIPSMQQTHATSDMRWAEDRVGPERVLGCYAWRRFYDAGCRIAGGSDFPVEHENPLLGFYAGITRQNVNGEPPGGWYADQCQTREEALRSLTIDAAYAAFEENLKGSLEAGKLADFVVLDRDIMKVPAAEVPGTKVLQTVVGGEVVFRAPRAPGKPGG